MIIAAKALADAHDDDRLNGLWQILGGGGDLFVGGLGDRDAHVNRLLSVIHAACGKDPDPYLAERRALSELADQVSGHGIKVTPGDHPDVDDLELAILDALARRLELSYATNEPPPADGGAIRRPPIQGTVDRLRDEQRSRLTMQALDGYAAMPIPQQRAFRRALAERTDADEAELDAALTDSPNALLSLLVVERQKEPRDIATAVLTALAVVFVAPGGFAGLAAANTVASFVMGPGALILVPIAEGAKGLMGRKRAKARTLIQVISYLHAGL